MSCMCTLCSSVNYLILMSFSLNSQDWIVLPDFLWDPGFSVCCLPLGILPDFRSQDSNMQTQQFPHRNITWFVSWLSCIKVYAYAVLKVGLHVAVCVSFALLHIRTVGNELLMCGIYIWQHGKAFPHNAVKCYLFGIYYFQFCCIILMFPSVYMKVSKMCILFNK
jgi:hypothetical protein